MQISGHSVPHSFSIKAYDANGSCSHMNLALVLRDCCHVHPSCFCLLDHSRGCLVVPENCRRNHCILSNLSMAPRWDTNGIITNGLSYSWHEWKYTFRDCATVFSHFPESKNKYVTIVWFSCANNLWTKTIPFNSTTVPCFMMSALTSWVCKNLHTIGWQ